MTDVCKYPAKHGSNSTDKHRSLAFWTEAMRRLPRGDTPIGRPAVDAPSHLDG